MFANYSALESALCIKEQEVPMRFQYYIGDQAEVYFTFVHEERRSNHDSVTLAFF